MVLFVVLAPLFFLGLPFLIMRLLCDVCRVRDPRARLGAYCVIVWALWQSCQLPPEQTGGGYYLAHQTAAQP